MIKIPCVSLIQKNKWDFVCFLVVEVSAMAITGTVALTSMVSYWFCSNNSIILDHTTENESNCNSDLLVLNSTFKLDVAVQDLLWINGSIYGFDLHLLNV